MAKEVFKKKSGEKEGRRKSIGLRGHDLSKYLLNKYWMK